MRTTPLACPVRRLAIRSGSVLLAVTTLFLGACSDDDSPDAADDTTTTAQSGEAPETGEPTETGVPVAEAPDDEYRISRDDDMEAFVEAARTHFANRYAGASFRRDVGDDGEPDGPELLVIHVVGATVEDEEWLQSVATDVDDRWGEMVVAVDASLTVDELGEVLGTVLERLETMNVEISAQLDMDGNRVIVDAPDLDLAQRAELRDGLPEGSVVFADELVDPDTDAENNSDGG